jgi:hypothetical protein
VRFTLNNKQTYTTNNHTLADPMICLDIANTFLDLSPPVMVCSVLYGYKQYSILNHNESQVNYLPAGRKEMVRQAVAAVIIGYRLHSLSSLEIKSTVSAYLPNDT